VVRCLLALGIAYLLTNEEEYNTNLQNEDPNFIILDNEMSGLSLVVCIRFVCAFASLSASAP